MKIELFGFKIENSDGHVRFDLFKQRTFQSGKNKGEFVWESEAWGVTFERAIQIIIQQVSTEEIGDVDLQTFVEQYNKITARILDEARKIVVEAQGTSMN